MPQKLLQPPFFSSSTATTEVNEGGGRKRPFEETSSHAVDEMEAKKRARTQDLASPGPDATSPVVSSSTVPSPTVGAPKIPSPAPSSIHTSPSAPHGAAATIPAPFFVRFGVDVFNSVEQQQRFHRDIIVRVDRLEFF